MLEQLIYLGTAGGVLVMRQTPGQWKGVSVRLKGTDIRAIAQRPGHPQQVLAGSERELPSHEEWHLPTRHARERSVHWRPYLATVVVWHHRANGGYGRVASLQTYRIRPHDGQ